VRFLFLVVILFGCQTTHNLKPSDTEFKESERDWEALYARELKNALQNEDVPAFYFFWPLYLQERSRNKCKKYNIQHNINCDCLNK
jgi:hypothetical protein